MSKLFGVDTTKKTQAPSETHHTHYRVHTDHDDTGSHDESTHETEARVEHHDAHEGNDTYTDHETDIGQIAVDVLDLAEEIIIIAPIAGVDPSDVDIALSRNILTLRGTRSQAPAYEDAKRVLVEECFYGTFSRSIILPENLAFNKIRATEKQNIIMIHIPKLTLLSKSIKVEK